jgi:hypothetical protein
MPSVEPFEMRCRSAESRTEASRMRARARVGVQQGKTASGEPLATNELTAPPLRLRAPEVLSIAALPHELR